MPSEDDQKACIVVLTDLGLAFKIAEVLCLSDGLVIYLTKRITPAKVCLGDIFYSPEITRNP